MGAFATMTSKGQVTIPKEIRDQLGLEAGTRLYMTVRNGEVVAVPKNIKLSDLAGMLGRPPNGKSLTIEEIDEAIMEVVADDDERIKREWREGIG